MVNGWRARDATGSKAPSTTSIRVGATARRSSSTRVTTSSSRRSSRVRWSRHWIDCFGWSFMPNHWHGVFRCSAGWTLAVHAATQPPLRAALRSPMGSDRPRVRSPLRRGSPTDRGTAPLDAALCRPQSRRSRPLRVAARCALDELPGHRGARAGAGIPTRGRDPRPLRPRSVRSTSPVRRLRDRDAARGGTSTSLRTSLLPDQRLPLDTAVRCGAIGAESAHDALDRDRSPRPAAAPSCSCPQ